MPSSRSPARSLAVTAGVGLAAVLAAAAAALPAAADSHGNSANAPGHNKSSTSGSESSSSGQSAADPAGNNGTVFIHDVANDDHPHNVPHVSCNFWVDFFGFDNSQQVTVSFAGQAPTGKDTQLGTPTTTTLQADDASGAGNDWDGELAFTADQLGVSNLGAPAHEGYHVKMTVVTNQPGDHKFKVFWIQPCAAETTAPTQPTTVGGTSAGTSTNTSSGVSTNTSTNTLSVAPTQASTTQGGQSTSGAIVATHATQSRTGIPTEVLGTKFTRGPATPASGASSSSLPFTGAEIGAMALAATVALGGGLLLSFAGRRRRRHVRAN